MVTASSGLREKLGHEIAKIRYSFVESWEIPDGRRSAMRARSCCTKSS